MISSKDKELFYIQMEISFQVILKMINNKVQLNGVNGKLKVAGKKDFLMA